MRKAAILLLATLAPAFSQKAHVEGRVTDIAGQPIAKAAVRLAMATAPEGLLLPPVYLSYSDAAGVFVFEDMEPDRYQLSAERAGYVRYAPSGTIDLHPGQTVTGIAIKMTPEALISGRVFDEDGDPFPNAAVLLCRWRVTAGQRKQQCSAYANSGPDGSFVIGSLMAGRYYLAAQDSRRFSSVSQRELPGRKGPEESFVTTYYPGVAELSAAPGLDLTTGGQVRGMDFRLRKARVFRIAGKALLPPEISTRTRVTLIPKDPGGSITERTSLERPLGGAFEFNRLLPGSYVVSAFPSLSPAQPSLVGRQVVTIGSGNVEDIVLQLAPAPEITVKLRTEESGTEPPRVRMTLSSMEETTVPPTQQHPDGTTSVFAPPSIYRITTEAIPAGTYVKSIHFGDQDVTRKPLDLTSAAGGILDVVFSPRAADVSGAAAPGLTVTLWDGPDFVRTVKAGADGRYRFSSLPPGEYRLAAWEKIDPGFSDLPEFLAKFEERATSIKLSENEHQNTDPVVVKSDDIEVEANKLR